MILTYRYRLLPTRRQHRALEEILESQRLLYNAALEERIDAWRKAGISRTYIDQCKALTEWRQSDHSASALPIKLQRATLKRLDAAYRGFFSRTRAGQKAGLPRFRGKGWFDSFGFREFQGITFDGRSIRFKGFPGRLRVHLHRPLPNYAQIRSCTFQRGAKSWTIGIAIQIMECLPRNGTRVAGIDLGISMFAMLSDGTSIPSIRAARRADRCLRMAQRALSRKLRGSVGREKARTELRRRHAAVKRARTNHLHQASARLVRDYDVIAFEDLNVKALAASRLAKDVRDASWGRFILMLRYKAERAGTRLVEVDSFDTSQECCGCGTKVEKQLRERRHLCPHCGLDIDRDLNAARNILTRAGVGPGLRNVAGCGMRAGGNIAGMCKDVESCRHIESLPRLSSNE